MCGITGILTQNFAEANKDICAQMTRVLSHRGPDGEGVYSSGPVVLGHRRLAIIDLTETGHQPMASDDGRVVVTYNGEVYNFRELRAELEGNGYAFRGSSDTEVIVNALHHWGTDAIKKFNGMFAFAAWFNDEKKLILARDRYGIKPLYYIQSENNFLFGSEIKALQQHPDFRFRVSKDALIEYFSFQNILSDLTLFEGVK